VSTVLINVGSRPVELHLTAGVVVVGPRERFDCEPADLELGHVQALCRQGVLEEISPEAEPPKARRAPAKRKRSAQKQS
jgi:hypothetical protein